MQIIRRFGVWIVFVPVLFVFSTYWYHDMSGTFGDILTFLSVVTGFMITGLSIIATSSFSKKLYEQEDPNDNAKTLLHVLVRKFTSSIFLSALIIALILIYPVIQSWGANIYEFWSIRISVSRVISSLVWLLTLFVLTRFIILIDYFAKFVIQAAKKP